MVQVITALSGGGLITGEYDEQAGRVQIDLTFGELVWARASRLSNEKEIEVYRLRLEKDGTRRPDMFTIGRYKSVRGAIKKLTEFAASGPRFAVGDELLMYRHNSFTAVKVTAVYERRLGLYADLVYVLSDGTEYGGANHMIKRADITALFDGLKAEG